jgi:hypothetical protein
MHSGILIWLHKLLYGSMNLINLRVKCTCAFRHSKKLKGLVMEPYRNLVTYYCHLQEPLTQTTLLLNLLVSHSTLDSP